MAQTVGRVVRYAVNVADMLRPEFAVTNSFLLAPVTPGRQRVRVSDAPDGDAVVLECDEARAAAVVDTILTGARNRGLHVRCYVEGPRGGWKPYRPGR